MHSFSIFTQNILQSLDVNSRHVQSVIEVFNIHTVAFNILEDNKNVLELFFVPEHKVLHLYLVTTACSNDEESVTILIPY